MYRHPFTLIRVVMRDASGRPLHKRPLWLILFGARRDEVAPVDAVRAYLQRKEGGFDGAGDRPSAPLLFVVVLDGEGRPLAAGLKRPT